MGICVSHPLDDVDMWTIDLEDICMDVGLMARPVTYDVDRDIAKFDVSSTS